MNIMTNFDIRKFIFKWRQRRYLNIGSQVHEALSFVKSDIPCFVVFYNNPTHAEQMVNQLNSKNITPIIFDNNSDSPVARNFLQKIHLNGAYVIRVGKNLRHKVGFLPGIYEFMPEVFAYTDPDLLFDSELPDNFLEILKNLTLEYGVFKAGSALVIDRDDIDTDLKILKKSYSSMLLRRIYSVVEWEEQFWRFPIKRADNLSIYAAPIDTTFAVYNKNNYRGSFMDAIRIAGAFSAIHLPWYPRLNSLDGDELIGYQKNNKSSTWVN
jgi:hypothetical protein